MIIDSLQEGLGCCGARSFEDWQTSDWFVRQDKGNNKVRERYIEMCLDKNRLIYYMKSNPFLDYALKTFPYFYFQGHVIWKGSVPSVHLYPLINLTYN